MACLLGVLSTPVGGRQVAQGCWLNVVGLIVQNIGFEQSVGHFPQQLVKQRRAWLGLGVFITDNNRGGHFGLSKLPPNLPPPSTQTQGQGGLFGFLGELLSRFLSLFK